MSAQAYAQAGVDIALADRLLAQVKPALKAATRPESLGSIGGFGGFFDLTKLIKRFVNPVLVSSTDSVGTKVKAASAAGIYRYLGADIVNHCANDVAVCGAEPLYFLDYYATGKLEENSYVAILKSLAKACVDGNIALVGGETAELPGVYVENEFDLVGSVVGMVDRERILTGYGMRRGDVILGLRSSGLHTNGFSLARKILFEQMGLAPSDLLPGHKVSVGKALLQPHVNYAPFLLAAQRSYNLAKSGSQRKGNQLFAAAHLTGGGFTGNIPRVLPDNLDAVIKTRAWKPLPVFQVLAQNGGVAFEELYEVFNMGIGMALVVAPEAAATITALAADFGHKATVIGHLEAGSRQVSLEA